MILNIKVIPRSSRNEIIRLDEKNWKIKLTAPPADGKANSSLIKILAKEFKIAKSKIKIVKGLKEKNKTVEIDQGK